MEENKKFRILTCITIVSLIVGAIGLTVGLLKNKSGESAYEIALKNGFEGTESEWLETLKGTDGKDGNDGKNGKDGKDAITPFDEFYNDFETLNTKLLAVDVDTYKNVYDRFSQLDIDVEDIFKKYSLFDNCFYYSYKDNQFIYIDLTNYLLNGKTVIYNQAKHYKSGNIVPVKSMDLYKFIFNKGTISQNYSNYLTSDYVPMSFVKDPWTGLSGGSFTITTNFDSGTHDGTSIVKYIRNTVSSGQEVIIRSGKGSLMVDAQYDTIYYYGNAHVYSDTHYPLNFAKLFINDEEYIPE